MDKIDITLLLTTHKHPVDAARVINEMEKASKSVKENVELLVIGHNKDDIPSKDILGKDRLLPDFKWSLQDKFGSAHSIWFGVQHCEGKWCVYLSDGYTFEDGWLQKVIDKIEKYPNMKLFGFNDGRMRSVCPTIGVLNSQWYRDIYPNPVYEHYAWDDEIKLQAVVSDGWMYCDDIKISHLYNETGINWDSRRRDQMIWKPRQEQLMFMVLQRGLKVN